jgi:7-keto-8-aminopelargonate synthetase-like enzyme
MIVEVDDFPGREITINNSKYLYFGGTGYLGLQTDEGFKQLFMDAIQKYGTNYGASRKSNIRISIFEKAENYLANLVGSEACLTLSSGYLAGQFLVQNLAKEKHSFFYAPNTHSALYRTDTPEQKNKTYITFSALNLAVRHYLGENKRTVPVVFLDAIDFSGANYPFFEGLKMLPLASIILVVDDSHGIGVVGENGGGVFRYIQHLHPKELIVSCSLGKGYGIQTGAIFGTKERIKNLMQTDFFGGASPANPASLGTLVAGKKIYTEKRQLLQDNIEYFKTNLNTNLKFKYMEGHPAFSFANENLTVYLEKNKILVTSFRYPNEDANLMSRIVLTAAHTKNDINRLCEVLNAFEN